ncbi:dihydrodipicolinate synthase [Mytilinidion resinicola]|uniref:Dihydrodipicolinate synthase n=1 Tax=Mytilinidion resinicola TaxID=574789 RepID=A0A6A6YWR9_9PEZI|nr:dihydrodipicolinate synthase [Mytilinidion resinicola]KAF2813008.1 dihydrodipicolinate synthase [Mytilinidion resinicola]
MQKSTVPNKSHPHPLPPGVYTPVLSLYKATPTQEIDHEAMYKHAQHLVLGGMHGLVYQGTNGETALLSREEKIAVLKDIRNAVADLGVPDYPIVAGLTKDAAEAGASFGLLLPSSFWPKAVTEDVLRGFYRDVADEAPYPSCAIMCFPGATSGVDLNSDDLAALATHPNIIGTKLTCGNVGKAIRLTSQFTAAQFAVFGGSSDFLYPTLAAGGVGCVTGMGNVWPKSTARVYDLYVAGELEEAKRLQEIVASAEWACKKSLALTKSGRGILWGRRSGLRTSGRGEKMQAWTVEVMGVLEAEEAKIPDRAFKGKGANGINGSK